MGTVRRSRHPVLDAGSRHAVDSAVKPRKDVERLRVMLERRKEQDITKLFGILKAKCGVSLADMKKIIRRQDKD